MCKAVSEGEVSLPHPLQSQMHPSLYSHMLHVCSDPLSLTDTDPGGRGGAGNSPPSPAASQTSLASDPFHCHQQTPPDTQTNTRTHPHVLTLTYLFEAPPLPWLPLRASGQSYSCLTCLAASFVISSQRLCERL